MSTNRSTTTIPPVSEPRDFPRKAALVSCARLAMHPRNIRTTLTDLDELAASIRAEGVLQPLLAHARFERRPGVADLEVIDGHRRLAAAEIAGLRRVPVIVRPRVTDDDALFAMLGAALKADVEDRDKARAVTVLNEEFDYTWTEIAARRQLPLDAVLAWRQDRRGRERPGRARPARATQTPGRRGSSPPPCTRCARGSTAASSPPSRSSSSCARCSGTGSPPWPPRCTTRRPPRPTRPARPARRPSHDHPDDDPRGRAVVRAGP
ncbi:ParB/RepB/Spo0J family partition protein [Pseudonocardia sp. RS010]|uniref:ParB/RepB/Spo0J family partition protein n=1 Tax=Pseudonocardia sp. RS010 TaxID=3385979 RepID=UPI0039A0FDF6